MLKITIADRTFVNNTTRDDLFSNLKLIPIYQYVIYI